MGLKTIGAGVVALGLAGCALASSSGVFKIGNDTYRITTAAGTGVGGIAIAKGFAYRAATHACAKQGRQLLVLDDDSKTEGMSASVDVTFRCDAPSR